MTGAPIFRSASGGPLSGFFFFPFGVSVHLTRNNGTLISSAILGRVGCWKWICRHPRFAPAGNRPARKSGPDLHNRRALHHSAFHCWKRERTRGHSVCNKEPRRDYRHHGEYRSKPRRTSPVAIPRTCEFSGILRVPDGSSTYHALQSTLSHRFTGSLYFQAAYTYSKSIDNGSGSVFGDELNGLTQYGNLLNPSGQRAVSDFDRRHASLSATTMICPLRSCCTVTGRADW